MGSFKESSADTNLNWEVFVTAGIPIVTPGVHGTVFPAMAATLIYGSGGAVLVDAFMTAEQANAPLSLRISDPKKR